MDRERSLDLLLAGIALSALSPVLGIACLAITLDDGPPLLFRQARVGRDRIPFEILKLRTMRNGRVTRAGRWLRATGIDELPQFLNVLRGEMSVVGPRPLTADDVRRLGLDGARFGAKPGITGLAQLFGGRGARHSRRLDRLQVARKSVGLDLAIVAGSFVVNVVGKTRARRLLGSLRRRSRRIARTVRPGLSTAHPAPAPARS